MLNLLIRRVLFGLRNSLSIRHRSLRPQGTADPVRSVKQASLMLSQAISNVSQSPVSVVRVIFIIVRPLYLVASLTPSSYLKYQTALSNQKASTCSSNFSLFFFSFLFSPSITAVMRWCCSPEHRHPSQPQRVQSPYHGALWKQLNGVCRSAALVSSHPSVTIILSFLALLFASVTAYPSVINIFISLERTTRRLFLLVILLLKLQ